VTVRVRLLGQFEVDVDGSTVDQAAWRRRQAAALVKLLALAPSGALHREQVIDALWPDLSLAEAAPRFHKAAHFARRAIGDGSIAVHGELVALSAGTQPDVDVHRFVADAEAALSEGGVDAARAALGAWTGPLLPADLYEPWTEDARERVEALRTRLLRQARCWEELVALDPTDEEAHVALMRELSAGGDRRAALRQFERLDRMLRRELGVGPGAEASALRDELQAAGRDSVPSDELRSRAADRPELHRIDEHLADVAHGRGRGLFVVGPPRSGKSSLLQAVAERAAAAGWRVGRGEAAAIEGAWPYAPVLDALADLCRTHPTLLDGLDDNLRAELEDALGGAELDWRGDAAHRRLFVAAAELVRLAAGGVGAVLIVDDVGEADEASLRLLHHLVRSSDSVRVLVVAAHGPGAEGSPLGAVRASLLGRGAASELVLDPIDGPESASVAALATLQPSLRDVLARVALTGLTFDTDLFVALSGLDERLAFDGLDEALASGVVDADTVGYRFHHQVVRDALVGGLAPHRLRALHREVADRLTELGSSPARVGHHLLHAGDTAAAVPFVLRAVRTEAALGAYRDALALLEPVRGAATGAAAAELAALRAELLAAVGDAGAVQAYRQAIDLAGGGARRHLIAGLARTATMSGDLDTASAALAGVEPDGGDADGEVLLARANLAFFAGDMATATAASEAAGRLVVNGDASWQLLDLISLQGLLAHQRGEWFDRLRLELRRTKDEPELARAVFDGHLCVAEYLLYGPTPYEEVIDLAVSLRRTAARSGAQRAEAFGAALAGEAALLSGRLDLAERHLQEAVELHREVGASAGEAHSLQRLAEARLASGDREGAHALLQRSLRLARWSTLSAHLLQRIYGTMIIAAPDATSARAMVDRAVAETGRDDFCEFCQVMVEVPAAIACAKAGDLEAARIHLTAAERSAGLWDGTSWQAAVTEARAHLAAAEGDGATAAAALDAAARAFEVAGHPLDARRCREAMAALS